jgi:hypothetical protein
MDFSTDVAAAATAEAARSAALSIPPGHVQFSTKKKDRSPRSVVEDGLPQKIPQKQLNHRRQEHG